MKKRLLLVALATTVMATKETSKFSLTGDAQFRLRYNYELVHDIKDKDSSRAPDFQTRYAWNLRLKVFPNEFITLGFRISNPGGYDPDAMGKETVTINDSVPIIRNFLAVPEAYFKWTPGVVDLTAGIIPSYGNTVLGLAYYGAKSYRGVGGSTWKTELNESLTGLMLGINYVDNGAYKIRSEIYGALAFDDPGSSAYDAFVRDQVRMIVNVPIDLKKSLLSIVPTGHFLFNKYRSDDNKKGGHSIDGGLEVKFKPSDNFGMLLGAAGGLFNNEAEKNDEDYIATAPLGMLLKARVRYVPSFGKLLFEFRYGRSRDREKIDPINYDLFFWDLKYAMPVKKLIIMPRFRLWYEKNSEEEHNQLKLRPALIFKAAF